MRTVALHKKDILMNKVKLKSILDKRNMGYTDLHERVEDYGLDITYKGFMHLLSNRVSWKLLYAHAIIEVLKINTQDIFDIVDVDIEKKVKDKEEWREKYEKDK